MQSSNRSSNPRAYIRFGQNTFHRKIENLGHPQSYFHQPLSWPTEHDHIDNLHGLIITLLPMSATSPSILRIRNYQPYFLSSGMTIVLATQCRRSGLLVNTTLESFSSDLSESGHNVTVLHPHKEGPGESVGLSPIVISIVGFGGKRVELLKLQTCFAICLTQFYPNDCCGG